MAPTPKLLGKELNLDRRLRPAAAHSPGKPTAIAVAPTEPGTKALPAHERQAPLAGQKGGTAIFGNPFGPESGMRPPKRVNTGELPALPAPPPVGPQFAVPSAQQPGRAPLPAPPPPRPGIPPAPVGAAAPARSSGPSSPAATPAPARPGGPLAAARSAVTRPSETGPASAAASKQGRAEITNTVIRSPPTRAAESATPDSSSLDDAPTLMSPVRRNTEPEPAVPTIAAPALAGRPGALPPPPQRAAPPAASGNIPGPGSNWRAAAGAQVASVVTEPEGSEAISRDSYPPPADEVFRRVTRPDMVAVAAAAKAMAPQDDEPTLRKPEAIEAARAAMTRPGLTDAASVVAPAGDEPAGGKAPAADEADRRSAKTETNEAYVPGRGVVGGEAAAGPSVSRLNLGTVTARNEAYVPGPSDDGESTVPGSRAAARRAAAHEERTSPAPAADLAEVTESLAGKPGRRRPPEALGELAEAAPRGPAAEAPDDASLPVQLVRARPAELWRRLLAWTVDLTLELALISAGCAALYFALAAEGPKVGPTNLQGLDLLMVRLHAGQDLLVPAAVLAILVVFVYSAVFAMVLKGRTPGRLFAGIRLVDRTGLAPRPLRALARAALALVSFGLLLSGFWIALFDRRGQTLHDRLTSTFVVRPS